MLLAHPMDLEKALAELAILLKPMGPGIAMSFIRTLVNSWCSSRRFHDPTQMPCIFGCTDATDALSHYLVCDPLWTITTCAACLDTSWLSRDIPHKLCLMNPSHRSILLMVLTHRVYHRLKLGYTGRIHVAQDANNFDEIPLLSFEVARLIANDLHLVQL